MAQADSKMKMLINLPFPMYPIQQQTNSQITVTHTQTKWSYLKIFHLTAKGQKPYMPLQCKLELGK